MGRNDNLVARKHAQRVHGDMKRIGAIGARYAVGSLHGGGKLILEALHERTADEGRGANHLGDGGVYLRLD